MKYLSLVLLIVFAFTATGCFGPEGDKVVLKTNSGDHTYFIDIADEKEEREMGLQYRESLNDNEGMFFVYQEEGKRAFWMPNMIISLDIIFFDKDFKVVEFFENVPPCKVEMQECPHYIPSGLAQYVLEVSSGTSRKIALQRGDLAQYN